MTSRVVELAGPAGAGKTTAVRALSAHRAGTRVGLETGRLGTALSLGQETPLLLERAAWGRWWTTPELRSIGYLRAWRTSLSRVDPDELVLLDHGPVFRLAMLLLDAPAESGSGFQRWWQRSAREWAGLLESVVCLDAPDEVLIHRIEDRPRSHRVRGADRADAEAFLEAYRGAFTAVLDVVEEAGTPVFHVDTSTEPRTVVEVIRSCIGSTSEQDETAGR
jgi:deoxyadenosine/deoxycytidine kinase